MKALDIELAVVKYVGYRTHLIVPNVSWGMGFRHECDILILSPQNYATEVEIKVSASDLRTDTFKRHQHYHELIKYLYFAVPTNLVEIAKTDIRNRAGILEVKENKGVCVIRRPQQALKFRPWTEKERRKLMDLAIMRYWSFLKKVKDLEENIPYIDLEAT